MAVQCKWWLLTNRPAVRRLRLFTYSTQSMLHVITTTANAENRSGLVINLKLSMCQIKKHFLLFDKQGQSHFVLTNYNSQINSSLTATHWVNLG